MLPPLGCINNLVATRKKARYVLIGSHCRCTVTHTNRAGLCHVHERAFVTEHVIICLEHISWAERGKERARESDRQTERQRQTETETETETETDKCQNGMEFSNIKKYIHVGQQLCFNI